MWGMMTLMNDLNKYMSSVHKFSVQENGYLSSLPYLGKWVTSLAFSWLSDWLIVREKMSTTNVRKLGTTIASFGSAICLVVASYAGTNKIIVMSLIIIGTSFLGTGFPTIAVNVLDLSPNHVGTAGALKNDIASVAGIVAPIVVGLIAPNQTVEQWRLVFWLVAVVLIVTNVVFLVYGSGNVQEWNDPEFLKKHKMDKEEMQLMLRKNEAANFNA